MANKALEKSSRYSQSDVRWHWQPRCILGVVVFHPSASRRQRCVLGWAGLQSSGAQTEVARCDSGLVLSEVRRHKYRPSAFRRGLTFLQKLTLRKYAVRVGDSSRLRSWRGVSRGAENVLRTEESTLEKQVSFGAGDSYFPRSGAFVVWVIIGVHIFQVLSRVRACVCLLRWCWPFLELAPVKWLLVPRCYPVGIIMQRLGVVLSASTSNISVWNSTLGSPRSGWCACSPWSPFSAPAPETGCGADDL